MRRNDILSEAWRNIRSGTSKAIVLGTALMAITTTVAVADMATIHTLDTQARDYVTSGAAVHVIESEGNIDGDLCTALAGNRSDGGHARAGAVRETASIPVDAMPGVDVPTFESTPHFPAMLTRNDDPLPRGIVASEDAAEVLGANAGGQFLSDGQPATVAATYPYGSDGRKVGFGYAVVSPNTTHGLYDECWVEHWPPSPDLENRLRGVIAPGRAEAASATTQMTRLNPTKGSDFAPHRDFAARITRYAPALLLLAGLALGACSIFLRRLELTAALHLGVSRAAMTRTALIEAAVWATPATLIITGSGIGYAAHGAAGDIPSATARTVILAGCVIAGVLVGVRAAAALTDETNLFRYFKER